MSPRGPDRLNPSSGTETHVSPESDSVVMSKWPYILAVYTLLVGPVFDHLPSKPAGSARKAPARPIVAPLQEEGGGKEQAKADASRAER